MNKKDVIDLVSGALTNEINFLPIRGLEDFSTDSGDIDIIVPPGQAANACLLVSEYARSSGWYLLSIKDLGYVFTICLHKPGQSNYDYSIKVDFINGLAWRGIHGDPCVTDLFSTMWNTSGSFGSDQRICGFVTFTQKIMASGVLTDKDWNRIASTGVDSQYLIEKYRNYGIQINQTEIESRKISMWKKWMMRFKSSGNSGLSGLSVWLFQVFTKTLLFKLDLNYKSGVLIAIAGMDGSGKSTLVDRFYKSIDNAGGLTPELIHLLPSWVPMPHQLISRKSTKMNYHRPYSEKPVKSKISGLLRLSYYMTGFLLSKLFISFNVRRGHLFIQDRSFFDFSSDLSRAKIPDINIPSVIKRLITPDGVYVYLDANPDVVISRKNELTLEKATALRIQYLANSVNFNSITINANLPEDTVYESFLSIIHDYMIRRIKSSINTCILQTPQQ